MAGRAGDVKCLVCFEENVPVIDGVVAEHHYLWRGERLVCPTSGNEPFTWDERSTRAAVPGRSGGRCEFCGAKATSMHHRIAVSQGGRWSPANILHLCGDGVLGCHGYFTQHPTHAKRVGVSLHPSQIPAQVPVLTEFGQLWLADDIAAPFPGRGPTT
jgi:hypothetical protein